jgi:cell division GTPase FtsZ
VLTSILICEAENRFTFLFGWGTGQYIWTVVADAAEHLGGQAVGVDALAPLDHPGSDRVEEVSTDA